MAAAAWAALYEAGEAEGGGGPKGGVGPLGDPSRLLPRGSLW